MDDKDGHGEGSFRVERNGGGIMNSESINILKQREIWNRGRIHHWLWEMDAHGSKYTFRQALV